MTAIRHLLKTSDLSPTEFWQLIDQAIAMKRRPSRYIRALYEKTLLMLFEAPSLRTRLSFETAMTQLHGHAIGFQTAHSPWGVGKESIEDVARTISRYCDAVCARLFSHEELQRLASNSEVPVINAMTNEDHPCQILGDFMTLSEKLSRRSGVHLAYCGDACNNVTYGLMRAALLTGNHLRVACPGDPRYAPSPAVLAELEALAREHPGTVTLTDDPRDAVRDAAVVYTDSWMSYRVPASEKPARLADLARYRVDAALIAQAGPDAWFMHCLPAARGEEVTAEVIDGPRSFVFDQAENRLHAQKALLLQLLGA